ncbi:hypothetical protein [Neisseria canis]|uniref:Bacteriocin class II with double-glycine leader peptide n=1 Tax=Neisseria canis TaxID=493 RepID=A0A448DB27_9NEIS|nr:hypothetical protein [Neisseria canis]OSI11691.1 hypothetical protein BWD07_09070 [Neisseria canis]VEF03362.1 Uncharacterised protein [Neisseria canis]
MQTLVINEFGARELTMAELDLIAGGAWSWKEFGRYTATGAVSTGIAGGVAGAAFGPGAIPGAAVGFVGGALGGAAAYTVAGWW